nr:RecName: Full=Uncharacterized protein 3; Flags: Precursor [Haliotis asinina]
MVPVARASLFTLACLLVSVCAQNFPGPPPGAVLRGPFPPARPSLTNRVHPPTSAAGMQLMRRMAVSEAVLSSDYTKRMTALDAIQNIPCVFRNPVLKYLLMDYMDMKPLPLPGSVQSQMSPATQSMILTDRGRRLQAGKLLNSRCVQSHDRLGALMYDIAEVPMAASAL